MVEESFAFLEENRVAVKPEHDEFSESVAEFMQRHGCQMAIASFLDRMCLALWASGLWLRYAALQNLIPSFPWIAPPPRPPP